MLGGIRMNNSLQMLVILLVGIVISSKICTKDKFMTFLCIKRKIPPSISNNNR